MTDRSTHLRTLLDILDNPPLESNAVLQFRKGETEELPYSLLRDRARQMAAGLQHKGLAPGDRVAFYAPSSPQWITACLGAVLSGMVVVPVDAQLQGKELAHVLEDSGASLVFTTADRRTRVEDTELAATVYLLDGEEDEEAHWTHLLSDQEADPPSRDEKDTAALFYTSGTTGLPKGVPLSHANLCYQIATIAETGLTGPKDRLLLPLPLHHVYPFVVGLLTPMALGLTIILPAALTGPELTRAIKESGATIVLGVPRLFRALFDGITAKAESAGKFATIFFNSALRTSIWLYQHTPLDLGRTIFTSLHKKIGPDLRIMASGGSAIDPSLAEKLLGLGWQVGIGYGLTETSPLLTLNPPGQTRIGSVGRTIPGVELKIAPPDSDEESVAANQAADDVPCAKVGEVLAKGPGVFDGYHELPDKTKETFTDDGWFRTGDLGCLDDDGWLYLSGRASTLIVTPGGENIQPDSVEEALSGSPLIREAAVLQEEERLVALVVPKVGEIRRQGIEDMEEAVKHAVQERSRPLPSYQRVNEVVVTRTPLPRTRLGKIRRHLLPGLVEEARGQKEGAEPKKMRLEDLSEEDRSLLENQDGRAVWEMLEKRYPDRSLSLDQSPQYDLSIDSLEWLNLTLEIRERTGVELDEAAIARIDTIRDLLEAVVSGEAVEADQAEDPLENPEQALNRTQQRWLKPRGAGHTLLGRCIHPLIRLGMRTFFNVTGSGMENIPGDEPVVITPNHGSYLDPFAVGAVLDLPFLEGTFWGGWTGAVFNNPLKRFLARTGQIVPIDPDRAAMSSLAFGAAVLKREKNLVWFPEGQRTTTGELLEFKPGLGMLLERYPVKVVPVAIHGAYEAWPPQRSRPRRATITVHFGKPVRADRLQSEGEGDEPHKRIVTALHQRVKTLLEETGSED